MKFKCNYKNFDIDGASEDDHIYKTIKRTHTFYEDVMPEVKKDEYETDY